MKNNEDKAFDFIYSLSKENEGSNNSFFSKRIGELPKILKEDLQEIFKKIEDKIDFEFNDFDEIVSIAMEFIEKTKEFIQKEKKEMNSEEINIYTFIINSIKLLLNVSGITNEEISNIFYKNIFKEWLESTNFISKTYFDFDFISISSEIYLRGLNIFEKSNNNKITSSEVIVVDIYKEMYIFLYFKFF